MNKKILIIIFVTLIGITFFSFSLFKKEKVINISRQCYYSEFDFTDQNATYSTIDYAFFDYQVIDNIITGSDSYFRAESDSYLSQFSGNVNKLDDVLYGEAIRTATSEGDTWVEDISFKINADTLFISGDISSIDLQKIKCVDYDQNFDFNKLN